MMAKHEDLPGREDLFYCCARLTDIVVNARPDWEAFMGLLYRLRKNPIVASRDKYVHLTRSEFDRIGLASVRINLAKTNE